MLSIGGINPASSKWKNKAMAVRDHALKTTRIVSSDTIGHFYCRTTRDIRSCTKHCNLKKGDEDLLEKEGGVSCEGQVKFSESDTKIEN